jgi:hypothetical protein
LQCVIDPLATQLPPGSAPELAVYDREKLFQRRRVAVAPIDEQTRDARPIVCTGAH